MPATTSPRPARDLPVLAFALLLPVAYQAFGAAAHWSARAALLLVAGAAGLGPMVRLLRRRDAAAIAAASLVGACALSAFVSDNPRLALLGPFALSGGTLFVLLVACVWALGRRLATSSVSSLRWVILTGALANAVVGLVQLTVDLGLPALGLVDNRPTGLLGSPIWLGMLASASVPLAVALMDENHRAAGALALATLGGAVQASGSRTSVLVLVGVVLWEIRRPFQLRSLIIAASVVVGVVFAMVLSSNATGATATDRFAVTESSQLRPRLDTWRSAGEAMLERPLLGWGPGRLMAATSSERSLATARAEGPERLFTDAHNLVVEYGATTGIIGLGALAAWLVLGGRRARGALATFSIAVAVGSLTEPQYVTVLPLAALAFGASDQRRLADDVTAARWVAVPVAVAAVLAAVLLLGDLSLQRAELDFRLGDASRAAALLDPWPQGHLTNAKVLFFRGKTSRKPALAARAVAEQRAAVDRDRADPSSWTILGDYQLEAGAERAAAASYRSALARNPWSTRAMSGLAVVAAHHCDESELRQLTQRMEMVGPLPTRARVLQPRCP